jgi:hypothetical protein
MTLLLNISTLGTGRPLAANNGDFAELIVFAVVSLLMLVGGWIKKRSEQAKAQEAARQEALRRQAEQAQAQGQAPQTREEPLHVSPQERADAATERYRQAQQRREEHLRRRQAELEARRRSAQTHTAPPTPPPASHRTRPEPVEVQVEFDPVMESDSEAALREELRQAQSISARYVREIQALRQQVAQATAAAQEARASAARRSSPAIAVAAPLGHEEPSGIPAARDAAGTLPHELAQAILYYEILSPPVSMRQGGVLERPT